MFEPLGFDWRINVGRPATVEALGRVDVLCADKTGTLTEGLAAAGGGLRRHPRAASLGDGANDTSAIRLADVGVAVGSTSTWAARAASDLLVLGDGLDAVVDSVAEGRAMWSRVHEAVDLLLGHNVGEIAFTALGSGPIMAVVTRAASPGTVADLMANGPREASFTDGLNQEVLTRAVTITLGAMSGWIVARLTCTPTRPARWAWWPWSARSSGRPF